MNNSTPLSSQSSSRQNLTQIKTQEDWVFIILLVFGTLCLLVGVVFPLIPMVGRSFYNVDGEWVGLKNYFTYLTTPSLSRSFFNTIYIGVATTIISVFLGFIYAYALTRTKMPGKGIFQSLGMLPIYIPPIAHAIGLIYLFGNRGLITTGFFGLLPGWNINLYGPNGIIIGEVLYCFPQAVTILSTALSLTDARLYEAAEALKTPRWRTFLTITLPGVKYGLISAIFVCFTLAFTDFGIPKVVGGDFSVLATEIYKQVIGQQNFSMGATVSVFLLIPTVIAFLVDRFIQRRQTSQVTAKSVPLQPKPNPLLDSLMLAFCSVLTLFIIGVFLTIIFASLVNVWPYKLNFSLRHYDFSSVGGGGYAAYVNTIWMSLFTAIFGTLFVFIGAYLIEKGKNFIWLRSLNYFLFTIPLALPGLVLGLAYVFFFNNPVLLGTPGSDQGIPNPFNKLYGTMAILVICNIIHFSTVCFLTANTALKQLDPEFESVSASMSVPFYKTFWRVTIPLCLPTILGIGIYYFVNAMVTVSAIIFLYPPTIPLAAVAIVNMDDAGDTAPAAAMSTLIVVTSIGIRLIYWLITKGLEKRSQAWLEK